MNPEEAIHNLQLHLAGNLHLYGIKLRQSMYLSLEALKQVVESRFDPSTWEPKLLPGETKE